MRERVGLLLSAITIERETDLESTSQSSRNIEPMKLQPFTAVNDMPFSISWKEVVFSHGKPLLEGRNGIGLNELDYGDVVFRFEDSGRLEEVSAQSPVLYLDNIAVPFSSLAHFVRANDPSSFERDGFLISPKFGLAFAPDNPNWVTALAAHRLDGWRDS